MAVQLAHARGVADDDALADAAEADDGAHGAAVSGDLGVVGHTGPVAQHHYPGGQDTPEGVHRIQANDKCYGASAIYGHWLCDPCQRATGGWLTRKRPLSFR